MYELLNSIITIITIVGQLIHVKIMQVIWQKRKNRYNISSELEIDNMGTKNTFLSNVKIWHYQSPAASV